LITIEGLTAAEGLIVIEGLTATGGLIATELIVTGGLIATELIVTGGLIATEGSAGGGKSMQEVLGFFEEGCTVSEVVGRGKVTGATPNLSNEEYFFFISGLEFFSPTF
jgi:hypothetical protein